MKKLSPYALVATFAAALALAVGCNPSVKPVPIPAPTTTAADPSPPTEVNEHGHQDGQHGGIIVSLGRDSYHVEAVVAADGQIRLFTLGKDETRVIDVQSQTLTGYVKATGATEAQEIRFEPTPQPGDAADRTSVFVGQLPSALVGQSLSVTIPNMRIDGERFRVGFETNNPAHSESTGMPAKVADDAEKELYLKPGGHYTAADIAANGNMTASQKFKGIKSDHNTQPQPGDAICPISGTKANAKFTWTIGGKPYQFCCPPCVDEFLTKAKSSTDPLPEPESFIKK